MMAVLETAASPHHTEANPEMGKPGNDDDGSQVNDAEKRGRPGTFASTCCTHGRI